MSGTRTMTDPNKDIAFSPIGETLELDISYLKSFCGIYKVVEIVLQIILLSLLGINSQLDFVSVAVSGTLLASWLIATLHFFNMYQNGRCRLLLISEFFILFIASCLHLGCGFRLIVQASLAETGARKNTNTVACVVTFILSVIYMIDCLLHIRIQIENGQTSIILLQCHKRSKLATLQRQSMVTTATSPLPFNPSPSYGDQSVFPRPLNGNLHSSFHSNNNNNGVMGGPPDTNSSARRALEVYAN